jgi:hypothetical protein
MTVETTAGILSSRCKEISIKLLGEPIDDQNEAIGG